MEDEREVGSQASSLWINPEFSSGQWPSTGSPLPIYWGSQSPLQRPPHVGKSIILFIQKKQKTKIKQNFINQVAFTYLACDFSGWCSKQCETHADTCLVTEYKRPVLLHQTRWYHNFHLWNYQDRHSLSDARITQTDLNHRWFSAARGHMLPAPKDL